MKNNTTGVYEASGLLGMGGFLFYYIGCIFVVDDLENPTLRFSADGVGDDFDLDSSEMEGTFTKPVKDLIGKCSFELATADFEEGAIELSITQGGEVVGVFTGVSEGLGEAVLKGTGKLSIPATKEHNNNITFSGDDTISNISFSYGNEYTITDGQPWGEVETSINGSKLKIDIGAGRKKNKSNAVWFNEVINSDNEKTFHTRGGSNIPSELNFAIKGALKINDENFNICIGQGSSGDYNNWHIASESITSKHPYKSGYLNNYYFEQDDSDEFKITKK